MLICVQRTSLFDVAWIAVHTFIELTHFVLK